ncbi:hypothetical protein KM043_017471 [Ampulex compressa]|nr:hypothetical protein KM043_017471 [Ampulex compressa]
MFAARASAWRAREEASEAPIGGGGGDREGNLSYSRTMCVRSVSGVYGAWSGAEERHSSSCRGEETRRQPASRGVLLLFLLLPAVASPQSSQPPRPRRRLA